MDDHAPAKHLEILGKQARNALAGNSYGVFSFLITVFQVKT